MNKEQLINIVVESQQEEVDKKVDKEIGNVVEEILDIVNSDDIKTAKIIKLSNYINELQDYIYKEGLKDGIELSNLL